MKSLHLLSACLICEWSMIENSDIMGMIWCFIIVSVWPWGCWDSSWRSPPVQDDPTFRTDYRSLACLLSTIIPALDPSSASEQPGSCSNPMSPAPIGAHLSAAPPLPEICIQKRGRTWRGKRSRLWCRSQWVARLVFSQISLEMYRQSTSQALGRASPGEHKISYYWLRIPYHRGPVGWKQTQ